MTDSCRPYSRAASRMSGSVMAAPSDRGRRGRAFAVPEIEAAGLDYPDCCNLSDQSACQSPPTQRGSVRCRSWAGPPVCGGCAENSPYLLKAPKNPPPLWWSCLSHWTITDLWSLWCPWPDSNLTRVANHFKGLREVRDCLVTGEGEVAFRMCAGSRNSEPSTDSRRRLAASV